MRRCPSRDQTRASLGYLIFFLDFDPALMRPKGGGCHAEEAPKMTVEVRLVTKADCGGDLGQCHRRITLPNKFPGLIQTHQEQVLMRRMAGELPEHQRKMAPTHLRQGCKLVQTEIFREISF
jgi:hypothetical protein